MMVTEINLKIQEVIIQKGYINDSEGVINDITFISESGDRLHVCGYNNTLKLLSSAIEKYKHGQGGLL